MGKNVYLIERLDPNDGDDVEWTQFNLGISEDGFFRTVATFFDENDALKFKAAVEWYEDLESFQLSITAPTRAIPPKTKRKTRSNSDE
jgi:hypothetical protein